MIDHQSDAELHMERLVQLSLAPLPSDLQALSLYDLDLLLAATRDYLRLMLALAVWHQTGTGPR